jgi:hypothetical protein
MPELNHTLEWRMMPDNGGQTRAQIHGAFIDGAAKKVQFSPGFEICKMHRFSTLAPGNDPTTIVSAWWTNLERWKDLVGFEDRVKMAKVFGVTVREICRVFLAVRENWNSFEYLAVAALAKPVWGFVGGVSQQVRIDPGSSSQLGPGEKRGKTANLPGRAVQIYIPFLTMAHLRNVRIHRLANIEAGLVKAY